MSGLPSGYKQLEYIESTGTQYIDTGVVPDANTKVECDFLAKTLDCGVFGARIDYNNNAFTLFWSATNSAAIEIGNVFFAIGAKAVVNKRCIVEMSATRFNLDGETLQTYSQTAIAPNVPIYIFWSSGASFPKLPGRVYGFKIYKNAIAVRDFIPCKAASGAVGLWDRVNSVFYANAGAGTFTAGPEILPPAAPTGLQTVLAVVLKWAASANADRYDVYRDGAKLGSTETTQYVDATPEANQTYVYMVKAVNGGGESAGTSITVYTKSGYFEYKPLIESVNFP